MRLSRSGFPPGFLFGAATAACQIEGTKFGNCGPCHWDSFAAINEPWCVAWLSHFMGVHAPGHRDTRATARAMHHVLLAHRAAVERLCGMGPKNLGVVLNFDPTDPANTAPVDVAAAALWDGIFTAGSSKASPNAPTPTRFWPVLARICPKAGRMTWR